MSSNHVFRNIWLSTVFLALFAGCVGRPEIGIAVWAIFGTLWGLYYSDNPRFYEIWEYRYIVSILTGLGLIFFPTFVWYVGGYLFASGIASGNYLICALILAGLAFETFRAIRHYRI